MKKSFLKFVSKYLAHKIYSSIDELPIYNWQEFHKKQDISLLIKKRRLFYPVDLIKTWETLYNEFYVRFGKSKEYLEYLKMTQKLVILICENSIKPDAVLSIRIEETQKKIDIFNGKNSEETDFFKNNAQLSKFIGFSINPKITSVAEYYGYLDAMRKQSEQNKQQTQFSNAKKSKK